MRSNSMSLIIGIIGAHIALTGTPASCSLRMARKRAAGEAARGSMMRFSSSSRVVRLKATLTRR
ncbi:hypothetical protein D9M68_812790 [compost metagenome]